MMLKMAVAEFKACFAQEKCEQETLQCSLLVEKHCSNSKKNGNGEAVGVSFWGCFLSKNGFKEAIGDSLSQSRLDNEWVEQDEPGVYITLTSVPGGVKDLKRVRFSWKRFSEKQAEQWWAENRDRVYKQYNVRVVDKSNVGVGSEDLSQVENLTRKAQLQEIELDRTTKQLKEALAFAEDEAEKCRAAKDVIKSLAAQLKDMAERLPVGAARNTKSPSLSSFGSSPASNEVSNASIDRMNGQAVFQEPDSNGSNNQLLSNGSTTNSNRNLGHNKQAHSDATTRNGGRVKESESCLDNEWVEQDEPGVYITLTSVPGGAKDLKRVRFSRKRFSEKQAEQWWAENRDRVYKQYNVRVIDKSNVGVGSEDLSH